jgi:hypothetical protein
LSFQSRIVRAGWLSEGTADLWLNIFVIRAIDLPDLFVFQQVAQQNIMYRAVLLFQQAKEIKLTFNSSRSAMVGSSSVKNTAGRLTRADFPSANPLKGVIVFWLRLCDVFAVRPIRFTGGIFEFR